MLRRYAPMRQSRGTVIPPEVREAVYRRDQGRCVPALVGIVHTCSPGRELDHIRSSGALGKKSPSTLDNLITTCPAGHRVKTDNGKVGRPLLLAYIEAHPVPEDCGHVDPVFGCCDERVSA